MKRLLIVFLVVLSLISMSSVYATVDFDPSQYTVEELIEIDDLIWKAIPKIIDGTILYDANGIKVIYGGLEEFSKGHLIRILLDVINDTDSNITLYGRNLAVNRYTFDFSNGLIDVVNNTIYLAKTDNRMELFIKELKMCDISNINSIDFDINIKNDQNGDWIDSFHVHLDVDYPVE